MIRQRNINQLIQTTRTHNRIINNIGSDQKKKKMSLNLENIFSINLSLDIFFQHLKKNMKKQVKKLPICCTNNKDLLLSFDSIHFSQNLIDNTIPSTSCITSITTPEKLNGSMNQFLFQKEHTTQDEKKKQ